MSFKVSLHQTRCYCQMSSCSVHFLRNKSVGSHAKFPTKLYKTMLSIDPRSEVCINLLQKHFPVHFLLSNILNILIQRQKRMQTITSPITRGNTKRTKGEIHPSAEGHEKTHVSKPSSDSEWFSQQSKQQIPHRGKKRKSYFVFRLTKLFSYLNKT